MKNLKYISTGVGLIAVSTIVRLAEYFYSLHDYVPRPGDVVAWFSEFDQNKIGVVVERIGFSEIPDLEKYPTLQGEVERFRDSGCVVAVTRGIKDAPTGELCWLPSRSLRLWDINRQGHEIAVDHCASIIKSNSAPIDKDGLVLYDTSSILGDEPTANSVRMAVFYLGNRDLLYRDPQQPNLVLPLLREDIEPSEADEHEA